MSEKSPPPQSSSKEAEFLMSSDLNATTSYESESPSKYSKEDEEDVDDDDGELEEEELEEGEEEATSSSAPAPSRRRIAFRTPMIIPDRELRMKRTSSPSSETPSTTTPESMMDMVSPSTTPTGSRVKRPWGPEEVQVFYEGVKMYGKDFESVGKFMAKRKFIKSKEHIKTFFFNSVKSYIRLLSLADEDFGGIPRDARELFLIVNACEWKKRTINMKISPEGFRELIFEGATTMKAGKRTITIRTPPCHSLSRYFSVKKVDRIPNDVYVLLEPTSNGDHVFMRNRDQNPYLRVKLNTNDRIGKFLEFLHRKWTFGGEMPPIKVTLWPDSSCELASLCVHNVENSPFVSLSMNKLIRNVEEQKKKIEAEKAGMKLAVEVNTKTKPTHTVIYPRPFNLTDSIIADGINFENVKNSIVAELYVVCGRQNPIRLRYQVQSDQPESRSQEPWKLMISLLERGYGECLLKKKEKDKQGDGAPKPRKRTRKSKLEAPPPEDEAPSTTTTTSSLPNANCAIVRRETDDFESQLAFLKRMPRKKTKIWCNGKDANGAPVLATSTPLLSIGPEGEAPCQDTAESLSRQVFVAPVCTVIPKKSAPVGMPMYQKQVKKEEGEMLPSTSGGTKRPILNAAPPTDFSAVFYSPSKRIAAVESQRKRTEDFLSSLKTPTDTPTQTPQKSTFQQYFGDELSMSPNSTRHASIIAAVEAGGAASTSVIDFADMMYKEIQDSADETTLSNPALDFSVSEVHRHYDDMMSSSQNSHDYLFDQFQKKKKKAMEMKKP